MLKKKNVMSLLNKNHTVPGLCFHCTGVRLIQVTLMWIILESFSVTNPQVLLLKKKSYSKVKTFSSGITINPSSYR